MPSRRVAPALIVPMLLLATIIGWAAPAAPAAPAQEIRLEGPIAEGIYLRERSDPGPVTSVSVEVGTDAPVAFVPVLSGNRVDGGTESTSSMCHRVGGVVCINANYAVCPSCGQPFGGVVQDGVLLRSPTPFQDQVSVINGELTLDPWMWSAGLWARGGGPSVEVHGVNTGMSPGGIYLYTRAYGDSTGAPPGAYELVVRAPRPLWTGVGQRQPVELIRTNTGGDSTIPPDGAVISAYGSSVHDLWAFVDRHHGSHVELVTNTPGGLEQSFAGHPVLLRDGEIQDMDPADGKVSRRHPRTMLGWDDTGRVWVVVVDGRQRHSRGMTLWEAAEHLRSLGARHAVNFDGGGSSAMVTTCPSATGWCLRSHPSDGRERDVWVAVALVPRAAPAPPPPPATAPTTTAPTTTVPPTSEPSGPSDAEGGPDEHGGTTAPPEPADDAVLWRPAPAPETSSPTGAVVPSGEDAVAVGGLDPRSGDGPRVATIAAAISLVAVEAAALVWFLRRRRLG